jgi:hypothetical protein
MPDTGFSISASTGQLDLLKSWLEDAKAKGETLVAAGRVDRGTHTAWVNEVAENIARALGQGTWTNAFLSSGTATIEEMYKWTRSGEEAMDRARAMRIGRQLPVLTQAIELIDKEVQLKQAERPVAFPPPRLAEESFSFISSPALRAIAARDYNELALVLAFDATIKSRVLLAGSVTEAILLDLLSPAAIPASLLGRTLGDLINAAVAAEKLDQKTLWLTQPLNRIRNLGHPGAELRDGDLTASEARVIVELMQIVIDQRKGS